MKRVFTAAILCLSVLAIGVYAWRKSTSDAQGYDMHTLIEGLVDAESFFEVKPLFAPELIVGLGLLEGRPVAISEIA